MEKITLDFSNCQYISHIYKEIKTKFDLPQNYGENLDALWDSLDHYTPEPLTVFLVGTKSLSPDLKEALSEIIDVFNDVHKECPNIVFKIEK